jgi:uncharacterized protein (TIGR02118 family)
MIKVMALLTCKAGLSRQAFIDYYEQRHAPLIRSISPHIVDYRRNFLEDEGAIVAPHAAARDFDVITELFFEDEAAYAAAMVAFTDPVNAAAIAADEENLFDRTKTRFYRVQECRSV